MAWYTTLSTTDSEQDKSKFDLDAQDYLKDNVRLSLDLLGFQQYVGTEKPTVIT